MSSGLLAATASAAIAARVAPENAVFTWVAYAAILAFIVLVIAVIIRLVVLISRLWLMPLARRLRRRER